MFTYSVSDELIAAILDKKFIVESASVKNEDLTIRLLNTVTDTMMIVKFTSPTFSNGNFEVNGSYVEDISLYGYLMTVEVIKQWFEVFVNEIESIK